MVVVWLLPVGAVSAEAGGVRVEDTRGCLDAEAVELEVRSALGDRAVDGLDIVARLDDREQPWLLRLQVVDDDETLWRKVLRVQEVDCPYLPALVARSVEQGLSEVPGWGVALPSTRLPHVLGFRLAGSVPSVRIGVGVGVGVGVGGRSRLIVDTEVFGSAVQTIGAGGGQLLGWQLGGGYAADLPVGAGSVRLRPTLAAGPVLAFGRGFDLTFRELLPRVAAQGEIAWISAGVWQVGVRAEVPVLRVVLVDGGTGDRASEAAIRVGLVLGARIW